MAGREVVINRLKEKKFEALDETAHSSLFQDQNPGSRLIQIRDRE